VLRLIVITVQPGSDTAQDVLMQGSAIADRPCDWKFV